MSVETTDFYLTIASPFRASEVKEKGSRFIANLYPVANKVEAEMHLATLRKEFYDASHYCYAYRLGAQGGIVRAADDGEPSGTAGKPILFVLHGAKLVNTLCVVTRYFGGTKLGTGGLARAYSEAAQLAVKSAKVKTVYIDDTLLLTLGYDELAPLERFLSQYELRRYDAEYWNGITMKVDIRRSLVQKFKAELQDKFLGKIIVT